MPDQDAVELTGVVESVADLVASRPAGLGAVRLVAIDGPSGSGKTCFAALLLQLLRGRGIDAVSVSTDLLATWDRPFQWWPQWETGLLGPVALGRPGRLQANEWNDGTPTPGAWVDIPVPDVLITEGVSSGRADVAGRLSVLVWIETLDPAVRLEKVVARDGESSRSPLIRWQESESEFFVRDATRDRSDFIVQA